MKHNRIWLAFANESICNHRKALKELGFLSWTTKIKSKFIENDVVFLFMNDERAVRFKLKVDKVDVPREDSAYWIIPPPNDYTYRLKLVDEYKGNLLNEDVLDKVGFKGGGSILTPNCNNVELIEYINDVFELASKTVILPSNYIVVDLGSGAYLKKNIGHEVFNLEPNEVDGRFYGYIPPLDNPNIKRLGASAADNYVDGVMVIYVKKLPNSNNRHIVAFTDNAKVYAEKQNGSKLNRFINDSGKLTECTFTIESDYFYDLRTEANPFVFEVSGNDLHMFRKQRFYAGRYPKQEIKMLLWLVDYLQKRNEEEDNDFVFQKKIQETDNELELPDTSKQPPCYSNGTLGKTVVKKASISKQALRKANFKCAYDESHKTFLTNKGYPYMEGHHLIPCTVSNTESFWSKYRRNIDCVENIVCLCPICHRQIHFGNKDEKMTIIKSLYEKQIVSLKDAGLDISIDELFALYN